MVKFIGWLSIIVISGIFSTLWQSWLYQTSINWFLNDLNLTLLTQKTVAAGLLFIRFVTYHHNSNIPKLEQDTTTKIGELFGVAYLTPLIMFGIAAAIHRFM